jgi:hypothetical protein
VRGIDNNQVPVFGDAYSYNPDLWIRLAVILKLDCKVIIEDRLCHLEGYAALRSGLCGFRVIPFVLIIFHKNAGSP